MSAIVSIHQRRLLIKIPHPFSIPMTLSRAVAGKINPFSLADTRVHSLKLQSRHKGKPQMFKMA